MYASLEEAWSKDFTDNFKSSKQTIDPDKEHDMILPKESSHCTDDSGEKGNSDYADLYFKKRGGKKRSSAGISCSDFIEHLNECPRCREQVSKITGPSKSSTTAAQITEGFSGFIGVGSLDLLFIIAIGIIIIFILDCFAKLLSSRK